MIQPQKNRESLSATPPSLKSTDIKFFDTDDFMCNTYINLLQRKSMLDSTYSATPLDLSTLKTFVTRFFATTPLIPCFVKKPSEKLPLIDDWVNSSVTADDLDAYPDTLAVAIVLKGYVALDADGEHSFNFIKALDLPNTFQVSRDTITRGAFIFKLPEGKTLKSFKLPFTESDFLEVRSGSQYQVVAGLHPVTDAAYFTNNVEVVELTIEQVDLIEALNIKKAKKSITATTGNASELHNLIESAKPSIIPFLAKENREALAGCLEGGRNVTGFKLAADLLGVSDWANQVGISFAENINALFNQFNNNCKPPLTSTELDRIWQSASERENAPCLDEEFLLEAYQRFVTSQSAKDALETALKSAADYEITPESQEPETPVTTEPVLSDIKPTIFDALQAEIAKFQRANLKDNEIALVADLIAKTVKHPFSHAEAVNYVIKELAVHSPDAQEKQAYSESFKALSKAEKTSINVERIIQGTRLQGLLDTYALENGIPQEFLLMSFLTSWSSVLPKKFTFNFNQRGETIPTIFTLFVGDAASGKSLSVKPFVRPLEDLAIERNNAYIMEKKAYDEQLEDWKKLDKNEKLARYSQVSGTYDPTDVSASQMKSEALPEPKRKHQFLISDASFEAIKDESSNFKDFGLLLAPDEICDLLGTINFINKTKDGLSKLISVWNGENTLKNRVTGELKQADRFQSSILSTIQTDRFRQQFDAKDPSGIVSRFLMLPVTENIRIPTGLAPEVELPFESVLMQVFSDAQNRLFNNGNKLTIKNNQASLDVWGAWRETQEQRAYELKGINSGFSQWLYRNAEYTARIAMNLHAFRYLEGLEANLTLMSVESMRQAVEISEYLTNKAQLIFNQALTKDLEVTNPEKVDIFRGFIQSFKDFASVKVNYFATHSFGRRKQVIEAYGNSVKDKYLKKSGIIALFKDAERYGLGKFDSFAGVFTKNIQVAL